MSNVVRTYSEYRDHKLHQVVAYRRFKTMGKSKTVSPNVVEVAYARFQLE